MKSKLIWLILYLMLACCRPIAVPKGGLYDDPRPQSAIKHKP